MKDIWKIIAKIGIELHPERLNAVASKIATLSSANDFDKAIASFGPAADRDLVDTLGFCWMKNGELTPLELAAALRGASETADLMQEQEEVEMVWTGPFSGLVPSRHTEQVLLEVIQSAKSKLFIMSFVAYDIESIFKSLQNAIDRNVGIDILLESSKSHGGKIDIDSIDAFRKNLPSANIYTWSTESKASGKWTGVVHAKCTVADGNLAFITSANLTMAAMERNMELGVLVRGGNLPSRLARHLEALIHTGVIERL